MKWATPSSLPSQTGNSGKYLQTDGSATSWQTAVSTLTIPINAQTNTTYTLVGTDATKLVTLTNANPIILTVPNGVFTAGQYIDLQQSGAGQVTVQSDGTTVITGTGTKTRAQYSAATLVCTSANNFTLIGDIA
jgi:hypothetical protein